MGGGSRKRARDARWLAQHAQEEVSAGAKKGSKDTRKGTGKGKGKDMDTVKGKGKGAGKGKLIPANEALVSSFVAKGPKPLHGVVTRL